MRVSALLITAIVIHNAVAWTSKSRTVAMSLNSAVSGKVEETVHNKVLSDDQIRIFQRDGVLLVRGLISGEELQAAVNDVDEVGRGENPFGWKSYKNLKFHHWRSSKALKEIAFNSKVPKAAAQLINLQSTGGPEGPVRLLKDAILSFSPGNTGCGWHVDDKFFWPTEDEKTGVNVWIALTHMPAKSGGGLAVSPGSHKEKFAQDAIPIIRAGGTCGMEELSPETHQKLEAMKVVYDMEPGDAIIHDRWCFHKSDAFHEDVGEDVILNRYSIRYMPEDAIAFDNQYDPVYKDPKYEGKVATELKGYGGYYPQVYPNAIESEEEL